MAQERKSERPERPEKGAERPEKGADKPETEAAGTADAKPRRRREKRVVPRGAAHVKASFNNTIVSLTDPAGNVIAWSSAGAAGRKGSAKSQPSAAPAGRARARARPTRRRSRPRPPHGRRSTSASKWSRYSCAARARDVRRRS